MSDYISRQAAIEALRKCQQYKVSKEDYAVDFAEVKTELMMLPTADVVEVVRCKDCEHFEAINNDDHGWCKMISDLPCGISVRYDDDYCSYGERRE